MENSPTCNIDGMAWHGMFPHSLLLEADIVLEVPWPNSRNDTSQARQIPILTMGTCMYI